MTAQNRPYTFLVWLTIVAIHVGVNANLCRGEVTVKKSDNTNVNVYKKSTVDMYVSGLRAEDAGNKAISADLALKIAALRADLEDAKKRFLEGIKAIIGAQLTDEHLGAISAAVSASLEEKVKEDLLKQIRKDLKAELKKEILEELKAEAGNSSELEDD